MTKGQIRTRKGDGSMTKGPFRVQIRKREYLAKRKGKRWKKHSGTNGKRNTKYGVDQHRKGERKHWTRE